MLVSQVAIAGYQPTMFEMGYRTKSEY